MALAVPLSRFASPVGGGSAFFVRPHHTHRMIHPDGIIEFELPRVRISPRTTRDEFLASPLFAIAEPLNQNAPWSRYSFQPVTVRAELFAGDICFCSGLIDTASLCSTRPEFGSSWSDASLEQERARHCFHKQLLQDWFERLPDEHIPWGSDERDADVGYKFQWGSVYAATDCKTQTRGILIKYAA